jgi:hypothetical protein
MVPISAILVTFLPAVQTNASGYIALMKKQAASVLRRLTGLASVDLNAAKRRQLRCFVSLLL